MDCMFFNLCGKPELVNDRSIPFMGKALPPPTVYQDAVMMLSGALSIYLVADLRNLARTGKATIPLEDLEGPIEIEKVLSHLKDNVETLKASGDYEDIEEQLKALESLKLHNSAGVLSNLLGGSRKSTLLEFGDKDSKKRLVHAITINDSMKRITVVFRGSVTKNDFITDAKVSQVEVDNPAFKLNEKTSNKTLSLHNGFHKYLFTHKCPETDKVRFESILDSVKELLKKNPGYSVYCTGHSLGAALCTIFGLFAAADDDINSLARGPVTVYSVASPYVGDVNFLLAFQSLERLGKLRHLRIANAEDIVSLMPVFAPKLGSVIPIVALKDGVMNLYKHCGIKLHLNDLSKRKIEPVYKLSYPQCQSSDESYANEISSMLEDGKNFLSSMKKALSKKEQADVFRYHSCEEYECRLNACNDDLKSLTLEDLYKNKNIVGETLNEDYVPEMMTSASQRISRISNSKYLQNAIKDSLVPKNE